MEDNPDRSDKPPGEPLVYSYGLSALGGMPFLFLHGATSFNTSIVFILVIFLIAASAVVSGSEVAYFSISPRQLSGLSNDDSANSKRIMKLLGKPDYLLADILIANNLFNIGLILSFDYLIRNLVDFSSFSNTWMSYLINEYTVNLVLITSILVIFGEVLPKIYATRYNVKLASFMSGPLTVLSKVFYPFSHVLANSLKLIQGRMKTNKKDMDFKEIGNVIDLMVEDEKTGRTQKMLKGIVEFANITVSQIQQPRVKVIAIDKTADFTELLSLARESAYSRIPIIDGDLDHIVGIVYTKELIKAADMPPDYDWSSFIREGLLIVPESKKIDDMLKEFKKTRQHMAFVVDEYGGTVGIVTLEDVVERVVGDIQDEHDSNLLRPVRLSDGTFSFNASDLIIDLCKHFEVGFDTFDEKRGDSDSIGGLLLEIVGGFPEINDEIECDDFVFTVLSKTKTHLDKIKVSYKGKEVQQVNRAV